MQLHGLDLNDVSKPYFLSASGDAATVSKATFKMFAEAAGLPKASANTLRKGATTKLREDPGMKGSEPEIMDHSKRVADQHYDQGRTNLQVSYKHFQNRGHITLSQVAGRKWLSQKNSGLELSAAAFKHPVDSNTAVEWSRLDEEERLKARELALQFQRDAGKHSNPVKKVTSQWRVLPDWRDKMADLIRSDPGSEIGRRVCPPAKFPKDKKGRQNIDRTSTPDIFSGDSCWTRTFYRFVDSTDGEDGEEVRRIEREVFHQVSSPLTGTNDFTFP